MPALHIRTERGVKTERGVTFKFNHACLSPRWIGLQQAVSPASN